MSKSSSKISWTKRRKIKFETCLNGFKSQFRDWRERTEQPKWSTHFTQVRAIETLLVGISDEVDEAAREAESRTTFAEELPELERVMLSGWRVWEFFRSKLAQRMDEQFQPGLHAADELAWACQVPLSKASAEAGHAVPREPTLVFLSGNSSPVALARGRKFWAEAAPGMGPLDVLCEEIIKHIPVPLISLPWHEIMHIPSLTAVAHEAGHIVEEDFRLTEDLNQAITAAVANAKNRGTEASLKNWESWRAEVFADFFAVRHCGPAFVGMLGDLLAQDELPVSIYPPTSIRMELCFAGLEIMGLAEEAQKRRTEWREIVGEQKNDADFQVVPDIINALASQPIATLGGKTFAEVCIFNRATLDKAKKIKEDLRSHHRSETIPFAAASSEDLPLLIAVAARLLYEESPDAFDRVEASQVANRWIASVNIGLRRGNKRANRQTSVSQEALKKSAKLVVASHISKNIRNG